MFRRTETRRSEKVRPPLCSAALRENRAGVSEAATAASISQQRLERAEGRLSELLSEAMPPVPGVFSAGGGRRRVEKEQEVKEQVIPDLSKAWVKFSERIRSICEAKLAADKRKTSMDEKLRAAGRQVIAQQDGLGEADKGDVVARRHALLPVVDDEEEAVEAQAVKSLSKPGRRSFADVAIVASRAKQAGDEGVASTGGEEEVDEAMVATTEIVMHLKLMLTSPYIQVQLSACLTIAAIANVSLACRQRICAVDGLMPMLVHIMTQGEIEAMSAIAALTHANEQGCDQARAAGAIGILAGFISQADPNAGDNEEEAKTQDSNFIDEGEDERRAEEKHVASKRTLDIDKPMKRKGAQADKDEEGIGERRASSEPVAAVELTGVHHLADLRGNLLLEAFALLGVGENERPKAEGAARAKIIPVERKAEVVATLQSIARSNDANLEAMTREKVIPALVKLMTKMKEADDGKSAQSGAKSDQSKGSGGSGGSKHKSKKEAKAEALDRKQLAAENKKLAEAAGQMLHALIVEGKPAVKKNIINAIIATTQGSGSVPPTEIPALMHILRSAAEEQVCASPTISRLPWPSMAFHDLLTSYGRPLRSSSRLYSMGTPSQPCRPPSTLVVGSGSPASDWARRVTCSRRRTKSANGRCERRIRPCKPQAHQRSLGEARLRHVGVAVQHQARAGVV